MPRRSHRAREPATDAELRSYAARRLGLAYRMAGQAASLAFDWTDFEYLGVPQERFIGAVAERDGKDWVVAGLRLSPTPRFVERCDAGSASSGMP